MSFPAAKIAFLARLIAWWILLSSPAYKLDWRQGIYCCLLELIGLENRYCSKITVEHGYSALVPGLDVVSFLGFSPKTILLVLWESVGFSPEKTLETTSVSGSPITTNTLCRSS